MIKQTKKESLFFRFQKWSNKRKNTEFKKVFDRGYNWAAGSLLRGELSPIEVEAFYDLGESKTDLFGYLDWIPGCTRPFDQGSKAATDRLCTLGVCIDDRFVKEPSPMPLTHNIEGLEG